MSRRITSFVVAVVAAVLTITLIAAPSAMATETPSPSEEGRDFSGGQGGEDRDFSGGKGGGGGDGDGKFAEIGELSTVVTAVLMVFRTEFVVFGITLTMWQVFLFSCISGAMGIALSKIMG